jgi:hypothetical protein
MTTTDWIPVKYVSYDYGGIVISATLCVFVLAAWFNSILPNFPEPPVCMSMPYHNLLAKLTCNIEQSRYHHGSLAHFPSDLEQKMASQRAGNAYQRARKSRRYPFQHEDGILVLKITRYPGRHTCSPHQRTIVSLFPKNRTLKNLLQTQISP